MEQFLMDFSSTFFGTTAFGIQAGLFLLALIGAIFGDTVRTIAKMKKEPLSWLQLRLGFITTFIFIRFGEYFDYLPTTIGALLTGMFFNEVAILILNKYKAFPKPAK